jgi:hypothetical protein
MARKKHPECGFCGAMMIRAAARVRKPGDERPKSAIPYSAIGWYCEKCHSMQSGDWLKQPST